MTTTSVPVPSTEIDLFADAVLHDPYPTYATLRAAGPAVRLTAYDAWVLPRHEQVRAALADHERFSSAQGVGYEPELNENTKGTVLASDPPEHDALRAVLSQQLAPRALARLRARIEDQADQLVADVVARGTVDAVAELAAIFPVTVVADLIGLPEDARPRLLRYADAAFNTFGPVNALTKAALPVIGELFEYLGSALVPERLRQDGWAMSVWAAADRGEIGQESVVPLLSAYVVASMDTTINAIGNTVWLFAEHPEAFAQVHADPSLVPSAFQESLRLESPAQGFFRTTTCEVSVGGVAIPAGARVLLSFGSANRDERRWERPTEFDVRRNPTEHVAFGYGIHGCAGQGLARLEAHGLIAALARRVARIELTGEPKRRLNNIVRGFGHLPVRFVSA